MSAPAPRRPVPEQTIKDPAITHGRYRVLQRTDGKHIVYDPELPPGQRTVENRLFSAKDEGEEDPPLARAEAFAKALALADELRKNARGGPHEPAPVAPH